MAWAYHRPPVHLVALADFQIWVRAHIHFVAELHTLVHPHIHRISVSIFKGNSHSETNFLHIFFDFFFFWKSRWRHLLAKCMRLVRYLCRGNHNTSKMRWHSVDWHANNDSFCFSSSSFVFFFLIPFWHNKNKNAIASHTITEYTKIIWTIQSQCLVISEFQLYILIFHLFLTS